MRTSFVKLKLTVNFLQRKMAIYHGRGPNGPRIIMSHKLFLFLFFFFKADQLHDSFSDSGKDFCITDIRHLIYSLMVHDTSITHVIAMLNKVY